MDKIRDKIGKLALKLYALPPSSAGIEPVFSTLGYVHSDIRNRLGQEKAAKLIIQRFNHNMWLFLFEIENRIFFTVF